MAIKVNNTTVIDDSRVLQNVTGLKTVGGQSLLGSGDVTVDSTPVGALQQFVGSTTAGYPGAQWIVADGSIKTQAQYPLLYSRLGTLPNGYTNSSNWTLVTVNSSTNQAIVTLSYLNGIYFGGGHPFDGLVGLRTSTNLTTWTKVPNLTNTSASALAYTNGKYYVYNPGTIGVATSTDLVKWSGISNQVETTAFDGNGYVAAGAPSVTASTNDQVSANPFSGANASYSPGVRTSTTLNGTWTERDVGFSERVNYVFGRSGLFIVVGDNGKIATSVNGGTSWTVRTSGTTENILWVGYANNKYIYTGVGVVATSDDGVTWTVANTGFTNLTFGPAAYGNGTYLITSRTPVNSYEGFITSTNLSTWNSTNNTWNSFYTGYINATNLQYTNSRFISSKAGSFSNRIYTSTNGSNWATTTYSADTYLTDGTKLYYIEFDTINSNILVKATNGAWTTVSTAATISMAGLGIGLYSTPRVISAVSDGDNLRFKVSLSKYYVQSTDNGNTWQLVTNNSEDYPTTRIFYENSLFFTTKYTVSNTYNLYTSTDAKNWTPRSAEIPYAETLNTIVYEPSVTNKYVGNLQGGRVITSTDAVTWTVREGYSALGTSTSVSNLVYGFNKFIVVSANKHLITSTDAVTWSSVTTAALPMAPQKLLYANNALYVGASSMTASSEAVKYTKDLVNYFGINAPEATGSSNFSFIYANNKLVMPRNYYGIQYAPEYTYNPVTELALPALAAVNNISVYIKTS